jgi:hypothetical protein
LRDQPAQHAWQLVSAADPLNLIGVITPDARVPATRANRIAFLDGLPIAARESKSVRWLANVDETTRQQAVRLLAGPDALRRSELAANELLFSDLTHHATASVAGLTAAGDRPVDVD